MPQAKPKRTLSSFIRGLDILEYIIDHGSVRPRDVAQHFSIPSSNVTLFLSTLVEKDYVFKDEVTGAYIYTNKFSGLFNHTNDLVSLLQKISKEIMRRLHKIFDENVLLSFLQDNHYTYYIDEMKSSRPIRIINDSMQHYPLHVTANGKVILSFMEDALQKKYLSKMTKEKYTQNTITSKQRLWEEIKNIQENKVAYNFEEYEEGIMAISSPIFLKNQIVASITVQFPSFRYHRNDLYDFSHKIIQAGEDITQQLKVYYLSDKNA